MNKSFLWKFLFVFGVFAVLLLWVLKIFVPETFGFYSLNWGVLFLSAFWGVSFLLRGVVAKTLVIAKKTYILLGAGFLVVAVFALVTVVALPDNAILPIVLAILAFALLLGVIATGGKKWDSGDNKQVGYKNYFQRKAAEEKQKNDK